VLLFDLVKLFVLLLSDPYQLERDPVPVERTRADR